MSAIAGIYHLDGQPVDRAVLEHMTDVVSHRGPDGVGHWVDGSIGLGHLQLCTTPESLHEKQPTRSRWGDHVITWDGRIDNREDLARELAPRFSVSVDSTDVDMVLAAYAMWGTDCVKHLVGDFAFALWDATLQHLFCARDPTGMRVFHYHYDGRRFVFGTEIKQLFQYPTVPCRLNELMVGLYLCGNFGDGETTFYQDIKRLPGGYSLVVSHQGLSAQRFWDPDPYDEIKFKRESEYAERFRELLIEAVRCRLRSSTPVEISLSGGVDSGSVASVAGHLKRLDPGRFPRVTASSWVYSHPDAVDESPYVRLICDRYEIPVTWLRVDDLWALKPAPSYGSYDEPFYLPFEAMHCSALDSAKKRGTRVVLSGEGGDETSMAGNMVYLRDWLRHLRLLSICKDIGDGTPAYRLAVLGALRRMLVPSWVRHLVGRNGVVIPPWIRADFAQRHNLAAVLRDLQPRSRRTGYYLQQRGRHPLFLGGDIRSALYDIEWRHPFYDSRIVEFLVRISPRIRFGGGRSKLLLRNAVSGILPDEVRSRAQHGAFGPLLECGLRGKGYPRLRALQADSHLAMLGIVDMVELGRSFEAYVNGDDRMLSRVPWAVFAEEWLRSAGAERRTVLLERKPSLS